MSNIDSRYFVIHGWMMSKLGLCGCDRDVYSIIYGFSQDGESDYHGSIQYLSELTQYSKRSCGESLKFLTESKLVIKYWKDGARSATYKTNFSKIYGFESEDTSIDIENTSGHQEDTSLTPESSSYNNKDIIKDKKVNNKSRSGDTSIPLENKYLKEKDLQAVVDEAVDFLNETCNTSFRKTTNGTKKHIKSLLKQGFSLQDMKNVILWKYDQWGKSPIRFGNGQMSDTYLRPDTLFSEKFESYLAEYNKNFKEVPKMEKINKQEIKDFEILEEY